MRSWQARIESAYVARQVAARFTTEWSWSTLRPVSATREPKAAPDAPTHSDEAS